MTGRTIQQPDLLTWEKELRAGGAGLVAGVDEVGRGALAGPLVAAAVILPESLLGDSVVDRFWSQVRDSKTLSASTRCVLAEGIRERAAAVSIAEVSSRELDEIGLSAANRTVMERAVHGLPIDPDVLLIDAMTLDLDHQQIGIIDGDALSLSIAAASIIAKVHRDTMLVEFDASWPMYGFRRHKGYGVPTHLAALRVHGPCEHHRQSFAPVAIAQGNQRGR